MERLWSPWRSQYIQSVDSKENGGCVFCEAIASSDDDRRYLVRRHEHCIAILNLYPYNSGHLLIVPKKHVPDFAQLDAECYHEMMEYARVWLQILEKALTPQGFNIGANVGRTAGAGIDTHVHLHIVPRWNGDTNFMPVVADTKVISQGLDETMHTLRKEFDSFAASHEQSMPNVSQQRNQP